MDDSLILRAALDRGWITPGQLTDALKAGAAGEAAGFAEILVARGWIDAGRAANLQSEMGTGSRAGRFVLLRELGRGGMGTVHEGWDPKLRRRVAVKILADALAEQEDVVRFYHEAQIAAALRHPGIVRIHEIGQADGRPFIVMDLLDGGTLSGRTFPPREAARLLAAVARAVAEAHRRGVIHRDLKPQNVLLDADGRPCVADFGLAKRLSGSSKLTAPGLVVGTPSYMAPEQARGLISQIDARSDVYALGAVLFEVLTGRPAVEGNSMLDILRRAAYDDVRAPSSIDRSIPRDLDAIVRRAMARERKDRYRTASAFADDLERFVAGRPVQARLPSRWPALIRRRSAALALFAAIALAAILIGILLAPRTQPPELPRPAAPVPVAPVVDLRARAQPDYDRASRLLDEARLDFYRADADLARTRLRLEEAVARFTQALRTHPAFGEAALGRGHALVLLRRPEAAHDDYTLAIERLPGSAEARLARGRLSLERVSQHTITASWRRDELPPALKALLRESEGDLRQARDLNLEKNAIAYLEAALAYLAADFLGVIVRLEGLPAEGTLKEDVLRLRARAWAERASTGRTDEERRRFKAAAIEDFTRLLELRVHDVEARRLRGSILFLSGRPEEAKADFEAVLRADPNDSQALSDMATYLYRAGRAEAVVPLLDRSVASDPANMRARSLRAVLRMERGDFAGARDDLEKSVESNPNYLPALLNLAVCLEKLGETAAALRRLDAILARQPDLPVAVHARGILQYKQGRWKEALADLEHATSLAPAQYAAASRAAVEECRLRLGLPSR